MDRFRSSAIGMLALLMVLILPLTTLAITTTNDPSGYIVTPPGFYDGVAKLDFVSASAGSYHGSGALINTPSNLYILTAAHLFTDGSGNPLNPSISATFYLSGGSQTISGAQYFVNPGWTGNYMGGYDIAIIKLSSPVSGTAGYDLLNTINWGFVGAVPMVGYGISGTGALGWDKNTYPFGTLRLAYNTLDGMWDYPNYPYAYDFDNGDPNNDTLGLLGLKNHLGVPDEGLIAEGDSGGPTFVIDPTFTKYVIAGIHSFGTRGEGGLGDFDGVRNSSFGELAGDTRVAYYIDWINDTITPQGGGEIPEPCTMILLGSGLLGLAGLRKKFKR